MEIEQKQNKIFRTQSVYTLSAEEINQVSAELQNVITEGGLEPSASDTTQVKTAISNMINTMGFGIPDYSAGVDKNAGTEYTAETNGWVYITLTTRENNSAYFEIEGARVFYSFHSSTSFDMTTSGTFFVGKGQKYKLTNNGNIVDIYTFFPCR